MIKKSILYEILTQQVNREKVAPIQMKIASLKEKLNSSDYKIIKCAEYSLAGVDSPYDIAELHSERQKLRDEINVLESEIAAMK